MMHQFGNRKESREGVESELRILVGARFTLWLRMAISEPERKTQSVTEILWAREIAAMDAGIVRTDN
jgi:hypothetical protein